MEHDTKPVTISIHAGLAKCCSTSVQLLIGAECKALAMQEVQKNQKSTHLRIFCGLNSTGKLAIQGDYAELMETLLVRFFDRDVERIENAKKVITFLNTICLREERLPDKFYEKLISHLTLLCDACGKSNRQITFILSSENLSPNPFNDGDYRYIKNIRIAKGGVKLYKTFMTDGKIIATGLKFDTGKATIKPESMGIINNIYKMMTKYA